MYIEIETMLIDELSTDAHCNVIAYLSERRKEGQCTFIAETLPTEKKIYRTMVKTNPEMNDDQVAHFEKNLKRKLVTERIFHRYRTL